MAMLEAKMLPSSLVIRLTFPIGLQAITDIEKRFGTT